jgi:hypothetical protein
MVPPEGTSDFDDILGDESLGGGRWRELARRAGKRGRWFRLLGVGEDWAAPLVVGVCGVVLAVAWLLPVQLRWVAVVALLVGPGAGLVGLWKTIAGHGAMPGSVVVVVPMSFVVIIPVALCLDAGGVRLTGQSLGLCLGGLCVMCAALSAVFGRPPTRRVWNRDLSRERTWRVFLAIAVPLCMVGVVAGVMASWPARRGGSFVAVATTVRSGRAVHPSEVVVAVQAKAGGTVVVHGSLAVGSPPHVMRSFERQVVVGPTRQVQFDEVVPANRCVRIVLHASLRGTSQQVSDTRTLAMGRAVTCGGGAGG